LSGIQVGVIQVGPTMETFPASVEFRGKEIPLFDEKQLRNVSRANLKQREPSPNRLRSPLQ
tara:strand:- start:26 stop:208 length:183 start_codon:yes stop_codon:yes gene_type:complete